MTATSSIGNLHRDHKESVPRDNCNGIKAPIPTEAGVPNMDEFERCEGSSFEACEESNLHDLNYVESNSIWDKFANSHYQLALLWLKRRVLAITMLVRTLIFGHVLRLVFGNISEWKNEGTPSWMVTVLHPVVTPQSRSEANAWPPPALIVLALLTVVTLVVHPDGLTWVLLGKIKIGAFSVMKSLSECGLVWITDYGVLPSIIAAIAIAGLMFVLVAMLRSCISPRRKRRMIPNAEKKKKKRKAHARHRSGKAKSVPSSPLRRGRINSDPSADSSLKESHSTHDENAPDLAPLTPISSQREHMPSDERKPDNDAHFLNSLPETTMGAWSGAEVTNSSRIMLAKSLSGRSRVPSVSTLDTTALSDDLSCSSKSMLSVPSVGAASTKSAGSSTFPSLPTIPSTESKSDKGTPAVLSRRSKRGGNSSQRGAMAPLTSECPSRWDALKPSLTPKNHSQQHDRQVQAKSSEKQLRPRQVGPHRAQTRKVGRGAVAGSKGLGGDQHMPGRCISAESSNNPLSTQSPVAPTVLDRSTGIFTRPPPPPGLGPIPTGLVPEQDIIAKFTSQQPSLSTTDMSLPVSGFETSTSLWDLGTARLGPEVFVPLLPAPRKDYCQYPLPDVRPTTVHAPARLVSEVPFAESPAHMFGPGICSLKENPFAPEPRDSEEQIEADLQALGGQMAGSILDF